MSELLFAGTHGHVVALDPASGAEYWRAKLGRGSSFVSLSVTRDRIFAGHYGQCYCLNKADGAMLWQNKLPNTGYHMVVVADPTASRSGGVACSSCQHVERPDARFCSQCGQPMQTPQRSANGPIYAALNGYVIALDRRTGDELWRHKTSGGSGCPVSLVFGEDRLYLGCSGRVFAIEPGGSPLWINDLPRLMYGVVTLAMFGAAGMDMSQTTLAAYQKTRNDAAAAGAASAS